MSTTAGTASGPAPATPAGSGQGGPGQGGRAALAAQLRAATDAGLAYLRKVDVDAATDIERLRRQPVDRPAVVVVGETKRGKSSLVNAVIGVPGLSPVDAAVATAAYLEFCHGAVGQAVAYVPGAEAPVPVGLAELRDWGTVLGELPAGTRPPRRIEVRHPAPLLERLSLVDTPGTGGLDPLHAEVALDAVGRAAALLFVVDASSPLSKPELDFLIEASKRVNTVLFALTKTDAYPGWRTILADNQAQVRAHAPRFGAAPWFAVSAQLAELAATLPAEVAAELVTESRIGQLRQALVDLAGHGAVLGQANVLRSVRSEFIRLDLELAGKIKATDPDPGDAGRARAERQAVANRKRTESRQWQLALSTETQRARVEATGLLRTYVSGLQEDLLNRIDKAKGEQLKNLPAEVDRALHALSVRLSADLEHRFRTLGERVLAQVFAPHELHQVLRGLNATLRHALGAKPRREGGGPDSMMIALSAGGMAFMAGRGAMAGASALGAGAMVGGGLLIPFAGLGLGLAAGAFVLYRRRVATDRQQARTWLREVLGEARAALADEIMQRFTDLQYALTLALDEAIERRLAQLDRHIADIDKAMAEDKAGRAKRKAALQASREGLRTQLRQVDEVLVKARALAPSARPGQERT